MKITHRKIAASTDYRTFDGFSLEELEEIYPDIYLDVFYDVRYDVETAFISRNPDCKYYGAQSPDDNLYYLWSPKGFRKMSPGWYEVTFEELSRALS